MNALSPEQCVELSPEQRREGLRRLEARSGQHLTALILNAIDTLIVFGERNFSNTILEKIVEAGKHPTKIERALKLYLMMFRLKNLCEPKGKAVGPTCALKLVNFETLSLREALELKNGFGCSVALTNLESVINSRFSALDVLLPEERKLYNQVKPYFLERKKPTLKILAARLLRNSEEKLFSDRNILRYIEALNDYEFADHDHQRDYIISSVNSFGTHNKSASESVQYALAQAVAGIRPLLTQQVIPVVLPQLQLAIADLYRSIPQTLSLLANMNLKVRQN